VRVTKRNGEILPLEIDRIHKVVAWACEGLSGVSESQVEIKSNLSFHDKIKTSEIQETLIKSAADLISEENPNYQYVAGRLVNFHLRKSVWRGISPPRFSDHVIETVDRGFYDRAVLASFTVAELDELGLGDEPCCWANIPTQKVSSKNKCGTLDISLFYRPACRERNSCRQRRAVSSSEYRLPSCSIR